jgi:hypothetical protein
VIAACLTMVLCSPPLGGCASGHNAARKPGSTGSPSNPAEAETDPGRNTGVATFGTVPSGQVSPSPRLSPDRAISQVEAMLDGSGIRSITLGPALTRSDKSARQIHTAISASRVSGADLERPLWFASLAQGDLAELLNPGQHDLGEVIDGSVTTLISPGGATRAVDGGAGVVAAGQVFGPKQTDGQVAVYLQRILRGYGLDLVKVRVWHLVSDAVEIVAKASDLRTVAGKFSALNVQIVGHPARFEGVYLQLDDNSGAPVAITQGSARVGAGGLWLKPDLPVDLGTGHG